MQLCLFLQEPKPFTFARHHGVLRVAGYIQLPTLFHVCGIKVIDAHTCSSNYGRSIDITELQLLGCTIHRLQPNLDTREKQLGAWCQLVKDYCGKKSIYELGVSDASAMDLFYNKALDSML